MVEGRFLCLIYSGFHCWQVDLPPADTMDVNLEGADGGDGADDTGSRDHAELDVTDAACLKGCRQGKLH